MPVCVYTCQNATLLEITCRGSFIRSNMVHADLWSITDLIDTNMN